jgi:hypothetical protein
MSILGTIASSLTSLVLEWLKLKQNKELKNSGQTQAELAGERQAHEAHERMEKAGNAADADIASGDWNK